jgi:hypothetical protein
MYVLSCSSAAVPTLPTILSEADSPRGLGGQHVQSVRETSRPSGKLERLGGVESAANRNVPAIQELDLFRRIYQERPCATGNDNDLEISPDANLLTPFDLSFSRAAALGGVLDKVCPYVAS